MLKSIKGWLGPFLSLVFLLNACTGGNIGDATPRVTDGPDPNTSDTIPGEMPPGEMPPGEMPPGEMPPGGTPPGETPPAAIEQCPGANADVSAALNGWSSSDASLPAHGALRLELKARPTETLTGLFAVGAKAVNAFNEAAIAVRFGSDGTVDARDGAFYSSDVEYAYDPGVWYSIGIAADIDAETYDVEIGPCGEPRQTLIKGASFRSDADIAGELGAWAVWASDTASLEISTPAWMPSGGCMPATCDSLGHACGAPSNGCGGALSCGTCGGGQTCESGTCVDAPVVVPPPSL